MRLLQPIEKCLKTSCMHCEVYCYNAKYGINKECPQKKLKEEEIKKEYEEIRREFENAKN